MADAGRLTLAPQRMWADPVTLFASLSSVTILLTWELVARSGLLYRDVVPSLLAIGDAVVKLLANREYYWHLGVTGGEIATALVIGGLSGPRRRHRVGRQPAARARLRALSLLSRPDAEDHLLSHHDHVVRGRSRLQGRHGGDLLLLPDRALDRRRHAADRQGADPRGKSFRANTWQMATKIYLPAMRHPVINGVRLGLGVAIIGTLLAETKLSNRGVGFMIIQAYSIFDMPRMYAMLIVLFVLAIGANALVARVGGLDSIRQA